MSTDYFKLRRPFTSADISAGAGLSLWVDFELAGNLGLRGDNMAAVLHCLRREKAACTRHGGKKGDTYLVYYDDDVELDTTLVSECGELTTLQKLKDEGTDVSW